MDWNGNDCVTKRCVYWWEGEAGGGGGGGREIGGDGRERILHTYWTSCVCVSAS